jgi:eukaryotic-like serine/threonine-protein kinase
VTTEVAAFATPLPQQISRCPMLRGTADLPPGRTLLFAVENLSVGDQIRHVTPIAGWRRPASLEEWQVRPPVGLPSDPLGERYRLELIAAPLAELKEQGTGRGRLAIPEDSYVAASVFVSRGSQSGEGCPDRP